MEDEVYICGWKQDATGITLWVKSNPRMIGHGASIEDAEESLANSISDNWGAMHAVFQFVPPLPKSDFDSTYSQPEIVSICGGTRVELDEPRQIPFETPEEFEIRMQWYDAFFQTPICRACGMANSPRSDKPLTLTYIDGGYDGGFLTLPKAHIHVYSDRFLKLLTADERNRLDFRLCHRVQRSRKNVFELIGPSGSPVVAIKERKFAGWFCEACNFRTFGHWAPDSDIHDFVAETDVGAIPEVFTIGLQPNVQLCISGSRWQTMVGSPGTKRMSSERIGVVPAHQVQPFPELLSLQEQERR